MRKIEEIDENFAIDKHGEKDGKKRYDVCDEPFTVYGVMKPKDANDMFRRMPQEVADSVSDNVANLSRNTAGGRIRFCTDSSYIGIYSKLPCIGRMPHFALTGSAGFDLYIEENGVQKYIKTYVPDYNTVDTVDGYVEVLGGTMKEYTLNMPLYSDVSKVQIILDENATVKKSRPYKYSKPVVYYGSSITQGGCASRPGNSYQAVLSRRLDCDYINLGFSGSALGEDEIAEYISKLDMSVLYMIMTAMLRTPSICVQRTRKCLKQSEKNSRIYR